MNLCRTYFIAVAIKIYFIIVIKTLYNFEFFIWYKFSFTEWFKIYTAIYTLSFINIRSIIFYKYFNYELDVMLIR